MSNDIKPSKLPDNDNNSRSQEQRSLQNQIKRQREWVYLVHYLAIQGLDPIHIVSGLDDGFEPDFTLIFWQHNQLVYIGVELTTLPRLRTQMSENGLIIKRWYWQSLLIVAKQSVNHIGITDKGKDYYLYDAINSDRYRLPIKTLYMPIDKFVKKTQSMTVSYITQQDIDAVMRKKKKKTDAYQTRRPLDKLWLLIHTDKYQPNEILTEDKRQIAGQGQALTHNSSFNKVHITRYPSYKVIDVKKI